MTKILIVDDSEITLEELKDTLEEGGYDVLTAVNGKLGCDVFKKHSDIALIYTDINMPVMSGLEMCEAILEECGSIPPVLAITTEVNKSIKERAKPLGVVGWLVKPYNLDALMQITEDLLNKYYNP